MKRVPVLLFLSFLVACSTVPPAREPVHIVIVGSTDVHGWFNGRVETPPGGGAGVQQGGLPAFAGYVKVLRAEYGDRLIVVDSGDMFQGTLESNLFEGEAVVRGYNDIGYAAAAVGNHEFDFGPVGPETVARQPGEDPLGALKRNAALARFPFLSANMIDRHTGRTPRWAHRWAIAYAGGAKIGIIGLSTPDTPNTTMSLNVMDLKFTDPVPATISAAAELRKKGADAVVVIAHMGGRCSNVDDPHSLDSCEVNQEAMDLLNRLPPGTVDALFAGHTHAQMRHYVNGVPALQALPYSRDFSTLDLWVDVGRGRVVKNEMRPHTMICSYVYEGTETCDARIAPAGAKLVPRVFEGVQVLPDPVVAATLEPFNRRVAARRDAKAGIQTNGPFLRTHTAESSIGNLLADALRESAQSDFAFMNSGGIRADLPTGDLTYGEVFAISPFDNYQATVSMTGAQIIETLRLMTTGNRGLMQVSGLRYSFDASKTRDPSSNPLLAVTKSDGTPIDPAKVYTVAMPDFLALGGDGIAPVTSQIPASHIAISYLKPIRDVVIDVVRARTQPITPFVEGRITIVNAPAK